MTAIVMKSSCSTTITTSPPGSSIKVLSQEWRKKADDVMVKEMPDERLNEDQRKYKRYFLQK